MNAYDNTPLANPLRVGIGEGEVRDDVIGEGAVGTGGDDGVTRAERVEAAGRAIHHRDEGLAWEAWVATTATSLGRWR